MPQTEGPIMQGNYECGGAVFSKWDFQESLYS